MQHSHTFTLKTPNKHQTKTKQKPKQKLKTKTTNINHEQKPPENQKIRKSENPKTIKPEKKKKSC
jgi:hypothetical protein